MKLTEKTFSHICPLRIRNNNLSLNFECSYGEKEGEQRGQL